MAAENRQKLWVPYLIAIIGIIFSFILFRYVRNDLGRILHNQPQAETFHPYIALFLGIIISFLIAAIVGMTQIANQRARSLRQTNEDLKKEIGERIHAEEVKQKLEVALLQGQKLQAIGTLAGGIAHDFNNLLYAIIGYVEMARQDTAKESLLYKNLGKVLDAGTRGRELVSRILAFSRRQTHNQELIDLKTTIEAALSLLRPTIPAGVVIRFDQIVDMTILGNQTQIHQVIVNLINNAADAMDGEGTITIKMSEIMRDDPFLREFPQTLPQNYCKIELSDTGCGMDQPTMERMFEPFFTTKEVGKGTGLGLSIVHSIIKDHQGEITVTSQLGTGTTFMILLPAASTA